MRKLIEFQVLDKNAEQYNVDLISLMDRAGQEVSNHIIGNYKNNIVVTIVCGIGNNGGDGYVVADILIKKGFEVNILSSGLSKSKIASNAYSRLNCEVFPLDQLNNFRNDSDILVDCLLGSGIKGRPLLSHHNSHLRHYRDSMILFR